MSDVVSRSPVKYSLDDLTCLMSRLRNPDTGCPWDIKQTFKTIAPCTVEEVYEVIDAIEQEDHQHLHEELGDLLFQIVFYAELAKEQQLFDFEDIVHQLVTKLVVRHPHVFPDGTLQSVRNVEDVVDEAAIKTNWETLKNVQRSEGGKHSVLDDISGGFPALLRAQKIQKRASSLGFDWTSIQPVMDKLDEEITELKAAVAAENIDSIEDELGDLIFTCVNAGRHLQLDAESALRRATKKFERRFRWVETEAGHKLSTLSESDLDEMWNQARQLFK